MGVKIHGRWIRILTRRQLLILPALGLVCARVGAGSASERKVRAYEADIAVLLNLFTFTLSGTVVQEIDRAAGSYLVTMNGNGAGITAGTEARGIIATMNVAITTDIRICTR